LAFALSTVDETIVVRDVVITSVGMDILNSKT
jgi:hypothetical protein